jgi:hypothetical protein
LLESERAWRVYGNTTAAGDFAGVFLPLPLLLLLLVLPLSAASLFTDEESNNGAVWWLKLLQLLLLLKLLSIVDSLSMTTVATMLFDFVTSTTLAY